MNSQSVAHVRDPHGYFVAKNARLLDALVKVHGLVPAVMYVLNGIELWAETRGIPHERVGFIPRVMRDGTILIRPYDTALEQEGPDIDVESLPEPISDFARSSKAWEPS